MPDEVRATAAAQQTAVDLQSLLTDQLEQTIQQIYTKCQFLVNPQEFEGRLASEYREQHWPAVDTNVKNTAQTLDELQNWLRTNINNILAAGGNA